MCIIIVHQVRKIENMLYLIWGDKMRIVILKSDIVYSVSVYGNDVKLMEYEDVVESAIINLAHQIKSMFEKMHISCEILYLLEG